MVLSQRVSAAYTLSAFGESAVPVLMEAFEDESEAIRRNAYYALSAIGAPAVDPLIGSLGHLKSQVRESRCGGVGGYWFSRTSRRSGIGGGVRR